jgi:superfamily II DNA or RNA helicase
MKILGKKVNHNLAVIATAAKVSQRRREVPSDTNLKKTWAYQEEALRAFRRAAESPQQEQNSCFLVSPTGSGKSFILCGHAYEYLKRRYQIVILVPQVAIKPGFDKDTFLNGEEVIRWPGPAMNNCSSESQGLKEFRSRGPLQVTGDDLALNVWVCTSQVFVDAVNDGMGTENLFVIVDEAHHIASEKEEEDANRLGTVFKTLWGRNVPHMFATATPFRNDRKPIIPPQEMYRYVKYTREMWQHLRDMIHMSGLSTSFFLGNVQELLREQFSKVKDNKDKVLVFLPNVNGNDFDRYARQLGFQAPKVEDKYEMEKAIANLAKEMGLSFASVATDESNKRNYSKLSKAFSTVKKSVDTSSVPDITLSLGRFREGVDCQAWSKVVTIGVDKSSVSAKQVIGRVTRDHASKANKVVSYIGIIPDFESAERQDQIEYAVDAVKSILVLTLSTMDHMRLLNTVSLLNPIPRGKEQPEGPEVAYQGNASPCPDHSTNCENYPPESREQDFKDTETFIDKAHRGELTPNLSASETQQLSQAVHALKTIVDNLKNQADQADQEGTTLGSLEQEAEKEGLPPLSIQLPVDTSSINTSELLTQFRQLFIEVTKTVLKSEAEGLATRIAKQNDFVIEQEIERLATKGHTPTVIASVMQIPVQKVSDLLKAKGLLRPGDSTVSSKKNAHKPRSKKKRTSTFTPLT